MSGVQWMVVLIVLIGVVGGIVRNRHRYDRHHARIAADPEARHLKEEVTILKERIAVLERVVTDNHQSVDLDRRIERLRDQR